MNIQVAELFDTRVNGVAEIRDLDGIVLAVFDRDARILFNLVTNVDTRANDDVEAMVAFADTHW